MLTGAHEWLRMRVLSDNDPSPHSAAASCIHLRLVYEKKLQEIPEQLYRGAKHHGMMK